MKFGSCGEWVINASKSKIPTNEIINPTISINLLITNIVIELLIFFISIR